MVRVGMLLADALEDKAVALRNRLGGNGSCMIKLSVKARVLANKAC